MEKVSQLSLLHKDSKAPLVTSGYSALCVNSGDEGQNTAGRLKYDSDLQNKIVRILQPSLQPS